MEERLFLKTIKYFLEKPYEETYLRELAKKLKISPFAAKKYASILLKENLITEERKGNLRYFKASTNNLFYKHLKISLNIKRILDSGLIGFIQDNIVATSSIILFGSVAKGEDNEKSDIDILIIGKDHNINFRDFEKRLGRTINTHIMMWNEWKKDYKSNRAFYYDIIAYGIPLYGGLPLVK
ncbi:nucleotidyltransferase domain-containing protein [Candidatus Pacearchaeota archaeon]|nr:nucleotidyltransferase domain-containing protein [Candidatus Pacearchaeota archaeon]